MWQQLVRAVKDRKHGWHLMQVGTRSRDGTPDIRTVVMRRAVREDALVAFHSDRRSPKVIAIAAYPTVALHWYDASRKEQLRATARAVVHRNDAVADEAWLRTGVNSRRCYLAPHAPSTPSEDATPNLPEDLTRRPPTADESEAGRANFVVVRCAVERLDWLSLKHSGHTRASFQRTASAAEPGIGFTGTFLEP